MQLVRRVLKSAEAEKTTVTEIATDYGFWELDRFAGAYLPVTIRRTALGGTASTPEDSKPDEIIEPAWKFVKSALPPRSDDLHSIWKNGRACTCAADPDIEVLAEA
jgi:hypothetical protein